MDAKTVVREEFEGVREAMDEGRWTREGAWKGVKETREGVRVTCQGLGL